MSSCVIYMVLWLDFKNEEIIAAMEGTHSRIERQREGAARVGKEEREREKK
jgi:hypothetical protein